MKCLSSIRPWKNLPSEEMAPWRESQGQITTPWRVYGGITKILTSTAHRGRVMTGVQAPSPFRRLGLISTAGVAARLVDPACAMPAWPRPTPLRADRDMTVHLTASAGSLQVALSLS